MWKWRRSMWRLEKKKKLRLINNKIIFTAAHFPTHFSRVGSFTLWKPVDLTPTGNLPLLTCRRTHAHHLYEVLLQKSRRCAIDSVVVTIPCNKRWNDNIFFFHLSSKVKVLATAEKICLQIIKPAGEVLKLAPFVARCTWHFFFTHSFFFFFFFLHKALPCQKRSENAPCSHRLPVITVAIVLRLNSLFLFPVRLV